MNLDKNTEKIESAGVGFIRSRKSDYKLMNLCQTGASHISLTPAATQVGKALCSDSYWQQQTAAESSSHEMGFCHLF